MSELHPQAKRVLDLRRERNVLPDHGLSVEAERERLEENSRYDGEKFPVDRVRETRIPGPEDSIPIRIYEPGSEGESPVVVFFHGGGFRTGSLDTHDALCRVLAKEAEVIVISVGYRLAPEHPFPEPLEDCYAVLEWAEEYADELGGDLSRLAVAGDSAGGNLAASTALLARDRDGPDLKSQLLLYPMTDYNPETESFDRYADGYLLDAETVRRAWDDYLRDDINGANPYASPLRVPSLGNVAPARVITCEFDPLRDDGSAYAGRLSSNDALLGYENIDDMFHGHLQLVPFMDRAYEDLADIASRLHDDLH